MLRSATQTHSTREKMGHSSLVPSWSPHLGAISLFFKSLLTVAFLDFNWAEAAPQDPGKREWIGFSLHYKGIIQAPKWQPAQISVKASVTPAGMKTETDMLAFVSLETQKCWGGKGKKCVCSFCSPLKGFSFSILLLRTRAAAEKSRGHLAASHIQEGLQLLAFDVSIKDNHSSSCWNISQLKEDDIYRKILLHLVCLPVALDTHTHQESLLLHEWCIHYSSQCK